MNENDKLVCINTEISKDVLIYGLVLELNRIYFYMSRTIGDDVVGMYQNVKYPANFYALFPIGTLEKNFMPYEKWLAEHREKQIKSVLDD